MSDSTADLSSLPERLRGVASELASLLAASTHDGIAILGSDGELVFWNTAAATITGWSAADAVRRGIGNIIKVGAGLREMREGKWVELRHTSLQVGADTYTVVLFSDSTPQVRLRDTRDQLRSLGLIDSVTNLPGRQLALLHIERAIALAKRDKRSVGLLSLKLDRFRQSGEPSQRETADEVVRQFAKRLSAFVRASDLSARLSEDAFLVVLTALSSTNDAVVVVVRLLLALAEPFDVVGRERSVQCSIGFAESPRDAEEALGPLGAALGAADRAQRMGGGRYCTAADTAPIAPIVASRPQS